jgi:hypothetical protein
MSGYTVVIDALRRSSTAANDLSTQLRAVDLDAPVAKLYLALPGTSAGPALTGLGELWRAAVVSVSDAAARTSRDLSAAADLYSLNEAAAAADLRVAGRPV